MKKYLIVFVVLCGVIAGAIVYLNKQKPAPPAPAAAVESAAGEQAQQTPPEKMAAPKLESPQPISENARPTEKNPVAAVAISETKPDAAAEAIHKAVDALLSAKSTAQKHDLFQQLIKAVQLDQAIAELKQRATDNPSDANIPTTLGEAQINKVGAIHAAGGDINEQGILAMQADQSFNAALKIDPQNWEANFVKAVSLSYWPAELNKGDEVVQRLSSLIDQQETMSQQPQFVQTYVALGKEFQKIGQPDKAQVTWQIGLTKFPNDPVLLKIISGQ